MIESNVFELRSRCFHSANVRVTFISLVFAAVLTNLNSAGASDTTTPSSTSSASALNGTSGSAVEQKSSSSRMLNGSANDKATTHPSVRLVPPTAEKHILNGTSNIKQFNGEARYSPGNSVYPTPAPAHIFTSQTPQRQSFTRFFPARAYFERPHTPYVPPAVPRWNYTLTPKNGVMTWSSGYQISHIAQPLRNQTFDSTKATISQHAVDATLRGAKASPVSATSTGTGAQRLGPAAPPPVAALAATPQLLTQISAPDENRASTWDEWYKRVCNLIYKQWILDEVCPGKACVRVTVWSSRDIEARVLSFTPAEGSTRDPYKETGFREISLRAINSLQKTAVLEFPVSPSRNQVIFDLDMNRSVDGPSGCVVAAFHDSGDRAGSDLSRATNKLSSEKQIKARAK